MDPPWWMEALYLLSLNLSGTACILSYCSGCGAGSGKTGFLTAETEVVLVHCMSLQVQQNLPTFQFLCEHIISNLLM